MLELEPQTTEAILNQNRNKTAWTEHDSPENMERLIDDEYDEFVEARKMVEIGADPGKMIEEGADLLILGTQLLALPEDTPIKLGTVQKLAEARQFFRDFDIDPHIAVMYKIIRNDIKYPNTVCSNGHDYAMTVAISKYIYQKLTGGRGDDAYREIWMEVGELMVHEIETLPDLT